MALNPFIPIAALGALGFLFFSSKSDAKAPASTTPEGQGGPPLGTPSTPATPSGPRPTSELSDAQRERMAEALGRLGVSPATGKLSGAADAAAIQFATQVIGELEAANFKEAAAILRGYTDEAAKSVQTPPQAAPIAQAAQAVMTKEQAEYVARVLALERDPNKIGLLIDWLKKLPPSEQRDTFIQMAQALALQLEAANITTDTLDKIDQVIQATPEPPAAPAPPVYTATSPGLPTGSPPVVIAPAPKPLPERPATVPAQPTPNPAPAPLTDAEIVGRQLLTNLVTVQNKYGVKGAKGREDKALVKKFQSLVGLDPDGSAGPATFLVLAAKGAITLPLVYYWPKTATAATVAEYRTNLEKIAQKHEQAGRRDQANTLRVSIAREHGEGGINGPLFGAPAASAAPKPATTAAPKPAPQAASPAVGPAAPNPAPGIAVDPYPNWRLLKRGMSGEDVKKLQLALLSPGATGKIYNVGTVDGQFGGGTETQVKAFQKDAGFTGKNIDGQVGPATRLALRKLGKW